MDRERQKRLADFTAWSRAHIKGDEKGEAQVFLDHLFRAFGQPGAIDVGGRYEERVRRTDELASTTSFADYVWKPIVLIEMKKRGSDLARHAAQAFAYWTNLAPNRPQYVVLCNFDEFWVYDPQDSTYEPADKLTLAELPERYDPLAFLFPTREEPKFKINRIAVTRGAADHLATCFNLLTKKRREVDRDLAQRFILQILVALFSEDIGLLERHFVTTLLDECIDPPTAFDLLGGLFRAMNMPKGASGRGGRFKSVEYFNGGIFSIPAPIELEDAEIVALRSAAKYNWAHVSPDIFGTIFQHSMGTEQRHAYGAHYTSQEDILKIVRPTIIDPFTTLIERASTLKDLNAVRNRLTSLRVLDPACGSGNFLYVAYREMRRLEVEIIRRENELSKRQAVGQTALAGVSPRQFFGLDILPFAVELAKVTLSIAPKLASDELHTTEPALPLANLDENITARDALIDADGTPTRWPACDVIIGNPPFLGAKRLKPEHGADYVNAVRKAYPDVPGMADYCVYWLRRAHDHLPICSPADPMRGRAGLVGTQNIRNNQSRVGGLDHIVKSGTIVEAVDNQPWSGEANVHVSIVNWVKTSSPATDGGGADPSRRRGTASSLGLIPASSPASAGEGAEKAILIPPLRRLWSKAEMAPELFAGPVANGHKRTTTRGKRGVLMSKSYEMAVREVGLINSALSDELDVSKARTIRANEQGGFCYTGQYPRHEGFMIEGREAREMVKADKRNRDVVHPFVVGREFLGGVLDDRWVIDFQTRDMLESRAYGLPFAHVQKVVLPYIRDKAEKEAKKTKKDSGQDQTWFKTWWLHFRPRAELIGKIEKLPRYLVCSRVTKRPVFTFLSPKIRPGDALSCFALADDYSFGILQSATHWLWFITKCSKLKSDFRYTPDTVFDTFPWPQSPTKKQVRAVAEAGREVRRIRAEALPKMKGGLRALYRTLELPGKNPLKDAHAALDAAVLDAYGFSAKKDLLAQLLALNLEVAANENRGEAVTPPGVPPSYGDASDLITDDCISP